MSKYLRKDLIYPLRVKDLKLLEVRVIYLYYYIIANNSSSYYLESLEN